MGIVNIGALAAEVAGFDVLLADAHVARVRLRLQAGFFQNHTSTRSQWWDYFPPSFVSRMVVGRRKIEIIRNWSLQLFSQCRRMHAK